LSWPENLIKSPAFRVPDSPVVATVESPIAAAVQVTVLTVAVPVVDEISVGVTVNTVCLPRKESI
jgi:hypothetical protein